MCGIVGAAAQRDVCGILLEGLHRLEYRGYDSAGVAVKADHGIQVLRQAGKVAALEQLVLADGLQSHCGIAHTRWATHGKPSARNAHPQCSNDRVAVVHNGIIENHEELRRELQAEGYHFSSETDTEVIAHLLERHLRAGGGLMQALRATVARLRGAYGLAAIAGGDSSEIVCARSGSPLVIGVGIGETFLASDQLALRQVTDRFVFLEEGDLARITPDGYSVENAAGEPVARPVETISGLPGQADKGGFRHFMAKEIFEQPKVLHDTLAGRVYDGCVLEASLGAAAHEMLREIRAVQVVACGTSFHAGLVARYWLEGLAGIPCQVEVASEFRYREPVVADQCLLVAISQSGETADTLAAVRAARGKGYRAVLAICNVAQSSLAREADICLMTQAGPEIGVASTKAFTTQLVALLLLTIVLGKTRRIDPEQEARLVAALESLPDVVESTLALDGAIGRLATEFADKHGALFLGRGALWPIAMEGALKLKEISYIHAESYPAGELKHGPLALVDADMPVVAVAPNDQLLEKLKSNLQEVRARGGRLYVFADSRCGFVDEPGMTVIPLPHADEVIAPIVYTVPLQLLAYHVAVDKGTDVDQPRNLAKSVTVE